LELKVGQVPETIGASYCQQQEQSNANHAFHIQRQIRDVRQLPCGVSDALSPVSLAYQQQRFPKTNIMQGINVRHM